jgi:hypothetical protein
LDRDAKGAIAAASAVLVMNDLLELDIIVLLMMINILCSARCYLFLWTIAILFTRSCLSDNSVSFL